MNNKKRYTAFIVLIYTTAFSFGAGNLNMHQGDSKLAYDKGNKIISAGLNFLYFQPNKGRAFNNVVGNSIPLNLSSEYGASEYLGIGVFLGYANWIYEDFDGYFSYNWHFISFGILGSLHYAPLLNEHLDTEINTEKWDIYLSLLLGAEHHIVKNPDFGNIPEEEKQYFEEEDYTTPVFGPVFGCRYYFSRQFSAYLEAGRGLYGAFGMGISFKF